MLEVIIHDFFHFTIENENDILQYDFFFVSDYYRRDLKETCEVKNILIYKK